MAPPPQSKAISSPAKGYATIALASAAGVIVASRMNRPALMLAAGLALSWWRRRPSAVTSQPEVDLPTSTDLLKPDLADQKAPLAEAAESVEAAGQGAFATLTSASGDFFPNAPLRTEGTLTSAWDDLRAAIAPEAGKWTKVRKSVRPLPDGIAQPSLASSWETAVPAMPDFLVAQPSSPWIVTEDQLIDGVAAAAPEMKPESGIQVTSATISPGAGTISPPCTEEAGSSGKMSFGEMTPPTSDSCEAAAESLPGSGLFAMADEKVNEIGFSEVIAASSPAVSPHDSADVSRDIQSKKSFFDWLRS